MRVVVIADAGDQAGLGHVSRAGAVAAALDRIGVARRCLALGAGEPFTRDGVDWEPLGSLAEARRAPVVVMDSYFAPAEEVARMGQSAELVLMPDETRRVRDACLRPQYWDDPERDYAPAVRRVLVTTGGGDPGEAGGRLALAAVAALPEARAALVRGPFAGEDVPAGVEPVVAPDSLHAEFLRADLVVCGAGQTMLEACASATPAVAVALADDQREQGAEAGELGAVRFVEEDDIPDALRELAGADARRALGQRAREVVDGQGALRLAQRIAELL